VSVSTDHHIVPQVYLRQFGSNEKQLTVYRKPGTGLISKPYTAKIKKIASESNFYTSLTENGQPDVSIEQQLSRFENIYPNVFKKIRSTMPIDAATQRSVAFLAALQFVRGLTQRTSWDLWFRLSAIGDANAYLDAHPGATEYDIRAYLAQNEASQATSSLGAVERKNSQLFAMVNTLETMTSIFSGMHLCVLRSNAHDFFTSDQPVAIFDPIFPDGGQHPYPYLRVSLEVTYPLGKRYAAFFSWMPLPNSANADSMIVSVVNGRVGAHAQKEVYVTPFQSMADQKRVISDLNAKDGEAREPLAWRFASKRFGAVSVPWKAPIQGIDADAVLAANETIPRWWALGFKE
jgi:hypothetical protein